MSKTIHLGGTHKIRWNSQRRFGVLGLHQDKIQIIKRTDSRSTAQTEYDRLDGSVKWLVDATQEDEVVSTTYQAIDIETVNRDIEEKRRKQERKEAKSRKRQPGSPCECGCGGTTGGGRYLPGHDAKHKSALIDRALKGDEAAEAELAQRNWTKFLEKKREISTRPKSEVKRVRQEKSAEDAEVTVRRLKEMQAAAMIVRELNRYQRSDDGYVLIIPSNAGAIVDGTFDYVLYDEMVADGVSIPEAARTAAQ